MCTLCVFTRAKKYTKEKWANKQQLLLYSDVEMTSISDRWCLYVLCKCWHVKGQLKYKKVSRCISVINNNHGKSKRIEFKYFYLLNVRRCLQQSIQKNKNEAKFTFIRKEKKNLIGGLFFFLNKAPLIRKTPWTNQTEGHQSLKFISLLY